MFICSVGSSGSSGSAGLSGSTGSFGSAGSSGSTDSPGFTVPPATVYSSIILFTPYIILVGEFLFSFVFHSLGFCV